MSVRFYYVDESYDADKFCLSAIGIRHAEWQRCFDLVKAHRAQLKADHGIPLYKEIHAKELVGGRGRLSDREIGKWKRSRIFHGLLTLVARLPNVMVINICISSKGKRDPQMVAWERLLNRIERCMSAYEEKELPLRRKLVEAARTHLSENEVSDLELRLNAYGARAFLLADEGKEREITGALRRMHVHNPIPSQFGKWPDGKPTKNIVTQHIIEDPFFKKSHRSYFVQLADCVAFALLKKEVPPTPNIAKYGVDKTFNECLAGVCWRASSRHDPLGIVRA